MLNTERIISRFPDHLQAGNKNSLLYQIIKAFGNEVNVLEDNLGDLMRSHWFDVCDIEDIEQMGQLFGIPRIIDEELEDYRTRFFLTVQELISGAGTVESIRNIVSATMGSPPEIIENPVYLVESDEHLVASGNGWNEEVKSIKEIHPTIKIQAIVNTRDPTITNVITGEWIKYKGLLRRGAYLTLFPNGMGKMMGIDIADRLSFGSFSGPEKFVKTPIINKGDSHWVYTDKNGFYGQARFDESVFCAGEPFTVKIRMKWEEYTPATFVVRIPLYQKRRTDGTRSEDSIGYSKHLRQEVRNLVDAVKTAGVMANINFHDTFTEKNTCRDMVTPQFNNEVECRHDLGEELEIEAASEIAEKNQLKDSVHICGAFNITTFDHPLNTFG